jgi:hypothetical protein
LKEKILVLVKAYPSLSQRYVETVCVAGVTDKGEWRRLYPVPYRRLQQQQRFKKYHWIEADTTPNTHEKLGRKESHKVDAASIRILSAVGTEKGTWSARNRLLLPLKTHSLEALEELKKKDKTSLGLIRPKAVTDFKIIPLSECREWERELIEGNQRTLFEEYTSPLEKIPWKFSYSFTCDDPRCKGHTIMCEDWELMESWRSWRKQYPTQDLLLAKIKEHYFDWMKQRDLHFFVGTEWRYNRFIIIGLYYPPLPGGG